MENTPPFVSIDWKPRMSQRCYTATLAEGQTILQLDRETSHHVVRVMRKQVGDELELFNGQGRVAAAVIQGAGKQAVTVAVGDVVSAPPRHPRIVLVQALIRPQPMDFILRKATELGVAAVQPVLTKHCVVRTRERPERWQKTVISAAEQCGANWLPEIAPVLEWEDWLQQRPLQQPALLGALTPATAPLRDVVRSWASPPDEIYFCVGPEGDWTEAEQAHAVQGGVVPVSFGSLTLRAETAALFGMAALRYEWGG